MTLVRHVVARRERVRATLAVNHRRRERKTKCKQLKKMTRAFLVGVRTILRQRAIGGLSSNRRNEIRIYLIARESVPTDFL